jgi:hypothetical protein
MLHSLPYFRISLLSIQTPFVEKFCGVWIFFSGNKRYQYAAVIHDGIQIRVIREGRNIEQL